MVNEVDFELYTEGPVSAAPYYGARLEPRGGTYFGMIAENSDFVGNLGAYLTYFSMDDHQTDIYYPANEIIRANDCVVTIGYTVNSLGNVDYDVIRQSLNQLASYGKPMFIRFANEMNVSALGDEPEEYIAVFRNVANMVHEYPAFAVVWSPNDLGALDRPFEYYYPGDEYVDWVGISSYGKKYFGGQKNTAEKDAIYFMTGDYAWATNAIKPIVAFMEKYNIQKPIMLSECGVATENIFSEDCSSWASPRFRNLYYNLIMKYPQVKLINYFNTYRQENERYYVRETTKAVGTDKSYAMYIMNEALQSGAYIRKAGEAPEFVFTPANAGYTLQAADGILDLYTLAYVPKTPYLDVNYYIDGVWYGKKEAAPYKIELDLDGLSDGEHTVRIQAEGMQKSYTFLKRGNKIRFGGEPDISVLVNNTPATFDQPPIIEDGRTLVPLRAIFSALGAEVNWDADTRTVTAFKNNTQISLTIDSDKLYVNGAVITLDVPAKIVNDRTLVPVRAVSEGLNCSVAWDGASRTVYIENR